MSSSKKRMSSAAKKVLEEDDSESENEQTSSKKTRKSLSDKRKKGADDDDDGVVQAPILQKPPLGFEYTDFHRSMLQYLMVKKVVDHKVLDEVSIKLGRDPNQDLAEVIQQLNAKLSNEDIHLQVRVRQMVEEEGKPKVYGLVNTRSDTVAKEATGLDTWKVVLFNGCLQLLAKSPDGSFSHTEAVHEYNRTPDVLSKSGNEIQQCLRKLASLGWLRETKTNFYTAGARTMLELSELLREYGAQECDISKQIIIPTSHFKNWLSSVRQH